VTARIFNSDPRAAASTRGLHGLRIGVHGQECRTERGDALDAARHRIADVMQLEIDENLLARRRRVAGPAAILRQTPADSRSCKNVTLSPSRAIIASALATPGRSSATINLSRGAISDGCISPHIMRWETSISCRTSALSASISARCFTSGPYHHRPRPRMTARADPE